MIHTLASSTLQPTNRTRYSHSKHHFMGFKLIPYGTLSTALPCLLSHCAPHSSRSADLKASRQLVRMHYRNLMEIHRQYPYMFKPRTNLMLRCSFAFFLAIIHPHWLCTFRQCFRSLGKLSKIGKINK